MQMALASRLIASQQRWSAAFDRLLPRTMRIDGHSDFASSVVPAYLKLGQRIYDVGGGRKPCIAPDAKRRAQATVIGLDISSEELMSAPAGAYDAHIVADLAGFRGPADGDLVICQAVLEHVRAVGSALEAIHSMLREEGEALLFIPSRNAVYARINLLLPHALKQRLLFAVFPASRARRTFPAYYHDCTPIDVERLAAARGFELVERRLYFTSSYFSFFFPLHVLWRIWLLLFRALRPVQAAETFTLVLRKRTV
jgi:2-polyprenyl-6-hydroxyphenyl methylase/3-demethylubiquinone-9 3-methyltransferase